MRKSTKTWLIVAISLILIGCILCGSVLTIINWDFAGLTTEKFETNTYTLEQPFQDITIVTDTADVRFVPTQEDKPSVVCYEHTKAKHSVEITENTLTIRINDERKWYEHIGIHFKSPTITVSLPIAQYGVVSIKSDTGDIRIQDISADAMDLTVSTGDVAVTSASVQKDIHIRTDTGDAQIADVRCQSIYTTGDTGDTDFKNVIAEKTFSAERDTGDIDFDRCDGAEVFLKTDTGDIEGSLLSEKIFIASANTGDVEVPKTTTGGKCEVTTNTGDIEIYIK